MLLLLSASILIAGPLMAGDVEKGKDLFRGCEGCHNTATDARKMGPSLRTLFGKVRLRNGKRTTDQNVLDLILAGYNGMPSYRYLLPGEEEQADLLAYLKTLRARPEIGAMLKPVRGSDQEVLSAGEKLFTEHCGKCHKRAQAAAGEVKLLKLVSDGHAAKDLSEDDLFRLLAYLKME